MEAQKIFTFVIATKQSVNIKRLLRTFDARNDKILLFCQPRLPFFDFITAEVPIQKIPLSLPDLFSSVEE